MQEKPIKAGKITCYTRRGEAHVMWQHRSKQPAGSVVTRPAADAKTMTEITSWQRREYEIESDENSGAVNVSLSSLGRSSTVAAKPS